MKRYGLGNSLNKAERERFGLTHGQGFSTDWHATRFVKAVRTGEFRPPRRGEWYLSGARVVAYRAPNDFTTPYHIARLTLKG